GQPRSYELKTSYDDVPPGEYMWAVGISDAWKDNRPGIFLAARQNVTEDGWLTLCEATVE
ncbi:MAG: DUF4832 domain-containing protein, partial [Bacteroidales bacterium]|nr:DUF4832 domain-containing protein [Bacteroidales bacterium]